ncbi:MAG: hypothetical protein ACLFWL_17180 [Candidatus Brocadiia bacterium]
MKKTKWISALLLFGFILISPPGGLISTLRQVQGRPSDNEKYASPFELSYQIPVDGYVTIDIFNSDSGERVRRLIAEKWREAGEFTEPWDLRDDEERLVNPGHYTWKGFVLPPLHLKREMSIYDPGDGKSDGKMRAPYGFQPSIVAIQGEIVWIGTPDAGGAYSLVALDLEGNLLWGTDAFSEDEEAPLHIAVDKRYVYVQTDSAVYRIAPQRDFQKELIYDIQDTEAFPRPGDDQGMGPASGGLAVRNGRLYRAVNVPSRWLASSFSASKMDPQHSQPIVSISAPGGRRAPKGQDETYGWGVYDELMKYHATFLTEQMPEETRSYPNEPLPSSEQVYYGDAPTDGKNKGWIVVGFKEKVTVGSVLIPDDTIEVQALEEDIELKEAIDTIPRDAEDTESFLEEDKDDDEDLDLDTILGASLDERWISLKRKDKDGGPGVAQAPEGGLETKALRYRVDRLQYSQIMAHRLRDIAPDARRVFWEGEETSTGGWQVRREDSMVTELQPAVMGLEWDREREIRGLSLIRPPGAKGGERPARVVVDRWTSAGDGDVEDALDAPERWEPVREFRIDHNPVVFQADFGRMERTKALRLRFLSGNEVSENEKESVVGIESVVAYEAAGDHPEGLLPEENRRIEVLDLPDSEAGAARAELVRSIPFSHPNALAFDADGTLHCLSDGRIVTVPLEENQQSRVVVDDQEALDDPAHFTFGPEGDIYVSDKGSKTVNVFDPAEGEFVRKFGVPGGQQPGEWDPARLENPAQVDVDSAGRVWVADYTRYPKRVMGFGSDGKPYKWFLGGAAGGGGFMDPRDRGVVMYKGMKFAVDWEDRSWRLDSLLGHEVERAIYHQDERYLVAPHQVPASVATVALERDNAAEPVAVVGRLGDWEAVRQYPELREKFGGLDPYSTLFLWSDRRGDGTPHVDEVRVWEGNGKEDVWIVGEDLSLLSIAEDGDEGLRLNPTSFTDQGIPLYDIDKKETVKTYADPGDTRRLLSRKGNLRRAWADDKGRVLMTGTRLLDSNGETVLWKHLNQHTVRAELYGEGHWYERPPGVLNQEHFPVGRIEVEDEEFFFTAADGGEWYCYTGDGFLVGNLFGAPAGDPRETGEGENMGKWRFGRGHYGGSIVQAEDGNVYAVAGSNGMNIIRIDGLEGLKRLSGEVAVSDKDVAAARVRMPKKDADYLTVPDQISDEGLRYSSSWFGNSWGGGPEWMQTSISYLTSLPDGRLLTSSPWDEGHRDTTIYSEDGDIIAAVPERMGRIIGGDDRYVYAPSNFEQNGSVKRGVARYHLDKFRTRNYRRGPRTDRDRYTYSIKWTRPAPFQGGVGSDNHILPLVEISEEVMEEYPTSQSNHLGGENADPSAPGESDISAQMLREVKEEAEEKDPYEDDRRHRPPQQPRGIASDGETLFVSEDMGRPHQIHVIEVDSMRVKHSFEVAFPGPIALDHNGYLWVVERPDTDEVEGSAGWLERGPHRIVQYTAEGEPTGEEITELKRPSALDFGGPENRLYVADAHPDRLQVFVYDIGGSEPERVEIIGEPGGLFAGPVEGRRGVDRLDTISGVGVDDQGRVTISTRGSTGSFIRQFDPERRAIWERYTATFMNGTSFDPAYDGTVVYSGHGGVNKFILDYSRGNGPLDTWVGVTRDNSRYPSDRRSFAGHVRRLPNDKLYLVAPWSTETLILRKEDEDSYIFAPSVLLSNGHLSSLSYPPGRPSDNGNPSRIMWRDKDGSGQVREDEYVVAEHHQNTSRWDLWSDGSLWEHFNGFKKLRSEPGGLMEYPLEGFDEHGNPLYDFKLKNGVLHGQPEPFHPSRTHEAIRRMRYNARTDTMYLAGHPKDYFEGEEGRNREKDSWGVGPTVVRYDNWSDPDKREVRTRIDLPWTFRGTPPRADVFRSMDVAGELLFLGRTTPTPREGQIWVYNTRNGEFLGTMFPGPKLYGETSLLDIPVAVNAFLRENGEYVVAVENNWKNLQIVYRIPPGQPGLPEDARPSGMEDKTPTPAIPEDLKEATSSGL